MFEKQHTIYWLKNYWEMWAITVHRTRMITLLIKFLSVYKQCLMIMETYKQKIRLFHTLILGEWNTVHRFNMCVSIYLTLGNCIIVSEQRSTSTVDLLSKSRLAQIYITLATNRNLREANLWEKMYEIHSQIHLCEVVMRCTIDQTLPFFEKEKFQKNVQIWAETAYAFFLFLFSCKAGLTLGLHGLSRIFTLAPLEINFIVS